MSHSSNLRLSGLLQRLMRQLHIYAQHHAERQGLCVSECRVLFLFRNGRPLAMKEIRSRLRITGAFATDIADRLFKHGLVVRYKSDKDRRKVMIALTDKGRCCLKELEKRRERLFASFVASLKEKDKKMIEKGVSLLVSSVEAFRNNEAKGSS